MCGITGLISFGAARGPQDIESMTYALRHRGPDDEGYLAACTRSVPPTAVLLDGRDSATSDHVQIEDFSGEANLYLGHRRLSIIDLSTAGHQPMQRGHHWLVFNGEIYNYLELRQELKDLGHTFTSSTDTEVILVAYRQWGEDCVTHFNGDWAFCIFDAEAQRVFLSRDRYGIKPLYYFKSEEFFCFASEIKSLLRLPFVNRSLNRDMAFDYSALFCKDHTEATLFDGICQLMPSHSAIVDLRTGALRKFRYYELKTNSELGEYSQKRAFEYAADLRDLLIDSVKLRLRADVPVGTCLSGGLDSSSIVAIVAKLRNETHNPAVQNTFTASFPGHDFDEASFAKLVVDRAGVNSHVVTPFEDGYHATLPTMLYHHDEPFGGSSAYSQWSIMRAASQYVKVMLDGQGADELLGGYRYHRVSYIAQLFGTHNFNRFAKEFWCTASLAGTARKAVAELKTVPFFTLNSSWQRKIYRLRYRKEIRVAREQFKNDRTNSEHIEKKSRADLNLILRDDLVTYSLPRLLTGEDRNSMAHAVEARVPFTDFRLVNYVFSIPAIFKIHNGWTKWLLRLAMQDLLPSKIVWRRDKIAFATPAWLTRNDEWDVWMRQVALFGDNEWSTHIPSSVRAVGTEV